MSAINYQKVDWKDAPTHETPLNASNLKKMDNGIYDLDQELTNTNELLGSASEAAVVDGDTAFEKIGQINENMGGCTKKWSGSSGGKTYVTVDEIAYDPTNKKLGLKVNGADSVIPFSGIQQSASFTGTQSWGWGTGHIWDGNSILAIGGAYASGSWSHGAFTVSKSSNTITFTAREAGTYKYNMWGNAGTVTVAAGQTICSDTYSTHEATCAPSMVVKVS